MPQRPALPVPAGPSLTQASLGVRMGLVAALLVPLWLAILWAIG